MGQDVAAAARAKALFLARLAEQAERYDEMAEHLREVSKDPQEFSAEERHLLSVAHANVLAGRRAARGRLEGAERCERRLGARDRAALAREYCAKVEGELDSICRKTGKLIARRLSHEATEEAQAFYHRMKADTFRHAAALKSSGDRRAALREAQGAYEEAAAAAEASALPAAHPMCFGLALSRSVFHGQELEDPAAACRLAPAPLQRAGPAADSRPKEPSLALASQRLCDLLLQFPSAAAGGVPWAALARAHAEAYGEGPDLAGLGYASPASAARALLAPVLAPRALSPCDAGRACPAAPGPEDRRGEIGGDGPLGRPPGADGPVLELADEVALTPLLGFAGCWPSLYRAICALVRHCGEQGGLLLSRMRPLLESLEAGGVKGCELPATVRETLLRHLRPLALAGKKAATAESAGWAFRDESGELRQLQKVGQLVQAMLRWRYQRLRLAPAGDAEPGPVEQALAPRLELAFAREFNNLVLRFADEQEGALPPECPAYYREFRPLRGGGEGASGQPAPAPPGQRPLGASAGEPRRRSSSEPPLFFMIEVALPPPLRAAGSGGGGGDPPEASTPRARGASALRGLSAAFSPPPARRRSPRCVGLGPGATDEAEASGLCRVQASPAHSRGAGRSRSRGRTRSRIGSGRARSLTEGPAGRASSDASARGESAERCRSEPPHARDDVAVFDDPFEPPPQELWASASRSEAARAFDPASYASGWASTAPRASGAAADGPLPWAGVVTGLMPGLARAAVPRAGSPSATARTRSLTRAQAMQASTHPGTPVAGAPAAHGEGPGVRSRSEPPVQRTVEIFDDPFEPPPEMLWASALRPQGPGVAGGGLAGAGARPLPAAAWPAARGCQLSEGPACSPGS